MLAHLQCSSCDAIHDARKPWRSCGECGGPLLARYRTGRGPGLQQVRGRRPGQWRLAELSPVGGVEPASLGEGATPLVKGQGLSVAVDLPGLLIKDEARNPTGSVDDRAMAAVVGRARELGVGRVSLAPGDRAWPSAQAFATLHGLDLDDAEEEGSLPVADAPWGVEGLKSIAFELVVELGRAPDVVLCPTGRGALLVGIAKGLQELEDLGWLRPRACRLVAVQTEACAPIVKAHRKKRQASRPPRKVGSSAASRLLVAEPELDALVLRALRGSEGTAIAVAERELAEGAERVRDRLGLQASPELGACVAAVRELRRKRWLSREELVVLVEPGSR